jgi:hypothetical protein
VKNSFPTLGVIGGGELARMFVAPAAALGVDLLIYASDPNDSAAQIYNHEIGSYKDLDAIRKFAKKCDVITFINELIPLSIIRAIEADGVAVRPSSASLELLQNKEALGLKDVPLHIAYPLLYRSASIILEAERLHIRNAVLILEAPELTSVISSAYHDFADLLSANNQINCIHHSNLPGRANFYFGLFDTKQNQFH